MFEIQNMYDNKLPAPAPAPLPNHNQVTNIHKLNQRFRTIILPDCDKPKKSCQRNLHDAVVPNMVLNQINICYQKYISQLQISQLHIRLHYLEHST